MCVSVIQRVTHYKTQSVTKTTLGLARVSAEEFLDKRDTLDKRIWIRVRPEKFAELRKKLLNHSGSYQPRKGKGLTYLTHSKSGRYTGLRTNVFTICLNGDIYLNQFTVGLTK